MPSQYALEQAAGITTAEVGEYISKAESPSARNALNLLRMQVNCYDPGGFALLKGAVEECKAEIFVKKGRVENADHE